MRENELKTLGNLFTNAVTTPVGAPYQKVMSNMHGFCSRLARADDESCILTAITVGDRLDDPAVARETRSMILTSLARWTVDSREGRCEPVRESAVTLFAPVLANIAARHPRVSVEWFEDMGKGLMSQTGQWSLEPQPLRLLRGLVLNGRFVANDDRMDAFWNLAAASADFPVSIFAEPCDFERRSCWLCPEGFGQLAAFFSSAPEDAVGKFAGAFAHAVRVTETIVYVSVKVTGRFEQVALREPMSDIPKESTDMDIVRYAFRHLGLILDSRWVCPQDISVVRVPVTGEHRIAMFNHVLEKVSGSRRGTVHEIFFASIGA